MNGKTIAGFVLAFAIGVVCRLAGIPLPAPPAIIGALLVVAMTVGYIGMDRFAAQRVATRQSDCGGPTGETRERTS